MPKVEDPNDPEIDVQLDVNLSGWVDLRMRRSQAQALAEKLKKESLISLLEVDEVDGVNWDDIVNALDGEITDIEFEDEGEKPA